MNLFNNTADLAFVATDPLSEILLDSILETWGGALYYSKIKTKDGYAATFLTLPKKNVKKVKDMIYKSGIETDIVNNGFKLHYLSWTDGGIA